MRRLCSRRPASVVHPGNVVHREILEVVVGPHEAARIVLNLLRALLGALLASLRTRHELALENLALRQQLGVLRRSVKRKGARPSVFRIGRRQAPEAWHPIRAGVGRRLGIDGTDQIVGVRCVRAGHERHSNNCEMDESAHDHVSCAGR